MHLFYILIIVLSVVQASAIWDRFKRIYNKQYIDANEEKYRLSIFEDNRAKINQHNLEAELGLHTYTLKINQFGDMTHEEFLRTMVSGYKKPLKRFNRQTYLAPSNVVIPAAIDWRTKGAVTTVIENQGQCGSCYAFAATGALEGQHFLKTGQLVRLSAQNIMDCSNKYGNDGCNGGSADASFTYIKENRGVDIEATYPYEALDGKCRFNRTNVGATDTGFVDIPVGNETALEIALATVGPIAVVIAASQPSFQFYSSGVYDEPACSKTDLDHPFYLVGYDTFTNGTTKQNYYIAKNSWGETWGNKGYIWMSRNKDNQCGIANIASYPLV